MNENLNLIELLKDVPEGTKLYSPICGECEFLNVDITCKTFPIVCIGINDGLEWHFQANGTFTENTGVECLLFPSKDNRDWSKFKAPKKHKRFEPFQKVLVGLMINGKQTWKRDVYMYYREDIKEHCTVFESMVPDELIIPYDAKKDGKFVK